jgi:hypothetical protein
MFGHKSNLKRKGIAHMSNTKRNCVFLYIAKEHQSEVAPLLLARVFANMLCERSSHGRKDEMAKWVTKHYHDRSP